MCKYCSYVDNTDIDYSQTDSIILIYYGIQDFDNNQFLSRNIFTSYDMRKQPVITWYLETWHDEINNYHAEEIDTCPYCGRKLD